MTANGFSVSDYSSGLCCSFCRERWLGMMGRGRCCSMYSCLFSSSSVSLANIGPSLPVSICLLLIATFSTLSVSRFVVADRHAHITVLVPKLFVVVLMSVAIIFAVTFFLLPVSLICSRLHRGHAHLMSVNRGQQLASFIRQNLVVVGILLFYVISSVPDLLRVMNESMCWQAWSQCSATHDDCAEHHVNLFYYSVRLTLTSIMVLMCWSFRGVVLCRNLFVTLGLATFAAAMSCLWFDTWMTELTDNLKHGAHHRRHQNQTRTWTHIVGVDNLDHNNTSEESYDRTRACLNHNTTIDNLLEGHERFFYPCTFELALLVIHCIIHWYSSSKSSSSSSCHQQANETSALLNYRSIDESRFGVEDDVSVTSAGGTSDVRRAAIRGQYSTLLIITLMLVSIVYCLLKFLAVYAHVYYFDNLFYRVRIWYETVYRTVMTTVLVVGLVIAGSSSRRSRRITATPAATKRQTHSGLEYLVLFTSWAPVVKSLLDIILYSSGSCAWITISVKTAYILGQTVAIFNVAFQTVFVFYAKNLRYPKPSSMLTAAETGKWYRRRSQFQAVLLIVALSNVALWATNSFVEINMAYGYSYHRRFYYHWIPIVSFVVPVAIFYYFNCALLCLDVLLNS